MKKNTKCSDCLELGHLCAHHLSQMPLHLKVVEAIFEAIDEFTGGPKYRGKPIPAAEVPRRERTVYSDKRKGGRRVKVGLIALGDQYEREYCECNCGQIRHFHYTRSRGAWNRSLKMIPKFVKFVSKKIERDFGFKVEYIEAWAPCGAPPSVAVFVPGVK